LKRDLPVLARYIFLLVHNRGLDLISFTTGALITGGLNYSIPAAPAAGFGISAVTKLITSRLDKRAFLKTVPMFVFIDLNRNLNRKHK
jgi:hypothetical protein